VSLQITRTRIDLEFEFELFSRLELGYGPEMALRIVLSSAAPAVYASPGRARSEMAGRAPLGGTER
jgi:hypothetical protein